LINHVIILIEYENNKKLQKPLNTKTNVCRVLFFKPCLTQSLDGQNLFHTGHLFDLSHLNNVSSGSYVYFYNQRVHVYVCMCVCVCVCVCVCIFTLYYYIPMLFYYTLLRTILSQTTLLAFPGDDI
jgi:hypothetical protein